MLPLLLFLLPIATAARYTVPELHARLLSPHTPFPDDVWASLSDPERIAWTDANDRLSLAAGMPAVHDRLHLVRTHRTHVPIPILIVLPDTFLTPHVRAQIAQYASGMRAGSARVALDFNVSTAPSTLHPRLVAHGPSAQPSGYAPILEQTALELGLRNALFLLLLPSSDPAPHPPLLGPGRVSWLLHPFHPNRGPNVPAALVAAEKAAERVYAPRPLYWPVPLIRQLRVELASYTPRYDRRALWLTDFKWAEFENAVRTVAVRGQTVGFFSAQANAECPPCEQAFRNVEKYESDFAGRAVRMLDGERMPGADWARGVRTGAARRRRSPDTFRIYVVDTVKLKKSEYLKRLERRMLWTYPGMALVVFRSSDRVALGKLEAQLLRGIIAGVYGIAEPELYMHDKVERKVSQSTKRPALVLFNVVIRNLVASGVEQRLAELEEIVEGILYFDVNPAKSLGDDSYVRLMQRINLLLFKLEHAQRILGDDGDMSIPLCLVSSTSHDIKAIRNAFDINPDEDSFDRFRDPTLRCHFSRLRREALKASQIFETRGPKLKRLACAMLSFSVTALFSYAVLSHESKKNMRRKRE